jgi:uncharacterized protein
MEKGVFLNVFQPGRPSFVPMFEQDIQNLVKSAELLKESLAPRCCNDFELTYRNIQETEHYGDELTRMIHEKLDTSIIIPFERKDIHKLTSDIDNVVDIINGISHRILIFNAFPLLDDYLEMAGLIYKAAIELEKAIKALDKPVNNKRKIVIYCGLVRRIERQADEVYSRAIAKIFDEENDLKILLSSGKVLEMMERCVDAEEDISDTIMSIVVKSV